MALVDCPYCGHKVAQQSHGTCPKCGGEYTWHEKFDWHTDSWQEFGCFWGFIAFLAIVLYFWLFVFW